MGQFAKWYKDKFPDISPGQTIDFDGMIWYQSPYYRLAVDKTNKKIIDFRVYPSDLREPYYLWPNREKRFAHKYSVFDRFSTKILQKCGILQI